MGHPAWLYYLFAIAMLSDAGYNSYLLMLSLKLNDPSGRDVDVGHIFMGVAMAGMFVARWAFWANWFWELAFFALMVWFIARTALSVQRFGLHVPHEGIHAVMSFAMLTMYWYPPAASGAASTSMSMSSSSHGILDPGLSLLLAFTLFGSAIFTLASPNKGASHHGTHRVASTLSYVNATGTASPPPDGTGESSDEALTGLAAALTAPRLEDLSHIVMCLGMGFLLILML
jgi:hypothetical protein